MADNSIGKQSSFNKTDIESAGQQFCHCCQNEYVWECVEDSENAPAALACGHLLCLSCIRTQWLDSTSQDGTVFCLRCTKRVTLVHLKTSDREVCESKTTESSENLLSVRSLEDNGGVWTLEQKDGVPEWVSTNICENFVLKLISGTDSCLAGSAMTLDNSTCVTAHMMKHEVMPDDSLSPIKQEHNSEKTAMSYIVNKSSSETIISDANFQDNSRGIPLQTLGSPDLNLKSLLQMLERNSLPSLGAGSENNEMKNSADGFSCIDIACKEEIRCFKKSQNVYVNHDLEVGSPVMPDKHLCEEIGIDEDWLPVGIVQSGSFITTKGKIAKMQTCEGYFPNSEIVSADNYICMTPTNRNVHEMDKVGVESVPQLWLSQTRRDFSHNNSSRSRRGRKRKPILRHCQSELFTRPYMKREHSPQLQLVKLVRQRALDKRHEEVKAALSYEEKFHCKTEMTKRAAEDPELAFMKTVDMPSGKRVEDIYVVPSVWISNEKKNAGKPSCSREQMNLSGTDFCHFFPLDGAQRVPQPVYCHGNQTRFLNTYQTPYWKQVQGSFYSSQPPPTPSFPNPSRKGTNSSLVSNAHSFKPTQNIYKVIKGHIITTLNAPKLDPVPTLKDLCKSALRLDAVTAKSYIKQNSKYSCASENQMMAHHSSQQEVDASSEMSSEIKTPKEFLDMQGTSDHQDLNFSDVENKTKGLDTICGRDQSQADPMNSTTSMGITNLRAFKFYDKTEKLSDNEENMPENPLFTEDITKTDTVSDLNIAPDSCEENLQAMTAKCKNTEQQFRSKTDIYPPSGPAETSHIKENFKSLYPTSSASLKDSSSDYIIPIVSYRLTDTDKNSYMTNQKSNSHNSDYIISQDHDGSNSYPLVLEDTYSDDTFDSDLTHLPSLVSVAKEIRNLASTDPLNKPLANLTAALNLLCNAEKSLCNSNFATYKQVKSESKSKLGRLSLCIRKLGDMIVTVGGTLQEWMKETDSHCFKTMGVLTEMYNSNIAALIELITPYFHHICELIASCHSEDIPWNSKETSLYDQSRSLAAHLSSTSWLDSTSDYQFSSLCRSDTISSLTYTNNQQSVSSKNYSSQDCDNSLPTKDGSDTSLSDPECTKEPSKINDMSSPKKSKALPTNMGQRKALPTNMGQRKALPTNMGQRKALTTNMGQRKALTTNMGQRKALPTNMGQRKALPTNMGQRKALPTNMGQRKAQISYLQNKQVSLVELRKNKSVVSDLKFGETTSGQESLLLPNTILVEMSSDNIWGEGNASDVHEPPNVISRLMSTDIAGEQIRFEKSDPQIGQTPTSSSSWMLPSGASDRCHSIPVQLSMSEESSKTTLSVLDSDLNSIIDDPDVSSVGDLKDTSSECSPNKKIKFENDDASAYSNIVVALPEGIKIVVSNASNQNEAATATCTTTNTLPLNEATVDNLNICSTDLHSFQNIYFIHNSSENPDDYLQLDPAQLSNALLNTFKGNKDVHENIGIAFMQNDDGSLKEEVVGPELVG